jgi:hypothetical protein
VSVPEQNGDVQSTVGGRADSLLALVASRRWC